MGVLLRGAMWAGGLYLGGKALEGASDTAEAGTSLVKWVVIGGVLYFGAKRIGAIK